MRRVSLCLALMLCVSNASTYGKTKHKIMQKEVPHLDVLPPKSKPQLRPSLHGEVEATGEPEKILPGYAASDTAPPPAPEKVLPGYATSDTAPPPAPQFNPTHETGQSQPGKAEGNRLLSGNAWVGALGIWTRENWQYKLVEHNGHVELDFFKLPHKVVIDGAVRLGEPWIVNGVANGNTIVGMMLDKAWKVDNVKPDTNPVKCTLIYDPADDSLTVKASLIHYAEGRRASDSSPAKFGKWVKSSGYDFTHKLTRVK